MRQFKLVVMTVGVALSATPFFNSAIAQQSNNQANLMLEVQSLRQEIAQLRDMVERQQFEMRKLRRQQVEMQKTLTAPSNYPGPGTSGLGIPQSSDGAYNGLSSDSNRDGAYQDPSAYQGPSANQGSSAYQEPSANQEPSTYNGASAAQTYSAEASNNSRRISNNGTVIEERAITAPPQGFEGDQQDGSVPVVDRSFSQQTRDVPVTGNGAIQQNNSISPRQGDYQQGDRGQVGSQQANSAINQVGDSLSVTGLGANDAAVGQVRNTNTGVIAVPQETGSAWRTSAQAAAKQATTGAIVANTVPVNPSVNSNQVTEAKSVLAATDSSADGSPSLSEDDYYGQGFELLKQSKYEEASTIFERQIKAYPRGNLADDAHYWIAEAMHVSRKLDVSKQHLKIIINDYPQSPRLPDAMLKTAYIEQSEGNKIEAQILFQEIVSLHPKSDAAIAAKNQLAASN
jgi:tol-pal system protein YbgF